MTKSAIGHSADDIKAESLSDMLLRIADADSGAFVRFRDATLSKVTLTALGVLRDHQAAEDVAQDVFLIVWSRAASYDSSKGSVIAWVSSIARNRSIDQLRSPRSRAQYTALDEVSELSDPAPSPYDAAELRDGLAVARKRMEDLPCADKNLLILAILQETPYRTLASINNMPLPTLKSRVRRALAKLSLQTPHSVSIAA